MALSIGSEPLFFSEELSWNSYLSPQVPKNNETADESSSNLFKFLGSLDARLCLVWNDLKVYSQSANMAARCSLDMDTALCQEIMVSAHYRLIHLRFEPGTIDETIRLALLAFASSVFLQGGGVWIRHEHLYRQLIESFSLTKVRRGDLPPQVMLWLYVFCVAFDGQEPGHSWLRSGLAELLQTQELNTWSEARVWLKSVIWADTLHDAIARTFVEEMLDAQ